MIDIRDVTPGKAYACKFKIEHILDEYGRIPGLSDTPLKGLGWYEGFGELIQFFFSPASFRADREPCELNRIGLVTQPLIQGRW